MSFRRNAVALLAGTIFGVGLTLSGMTDPARVLAFLDVAGAWDPTLAFVMAAAVATFGVAARAALGRGKPILDSSFHLPERTRIDGALVIGSIIFGVGWGVGGFCPGPAIASLARSALGFSPGTLAFVLALAAGAIIHDRAFKTNV